MKKNNNPDQSAAVTTAGVQAATLHKPDYEFIRQLETAGITQENWDSGRSANVTMKHAYKFTHSVEMSKGEWSHNLGETKGFDLNSVSAMDVDGELPLSVLLRDRLNMESLVLLKDGELVDEFYWSGMHKDHTHLMMSVTKSFTRLTLQTLVDEGLVDMNALITQYVPGLKTSTAFADATVQQVADMRSGVKIEFTPGKTWDERMTHVQEWNGRNNYPEFQSILDFTKTLSKRTDVQTGQAFDYQCVNTEMLGMIITHVTGKPLADVMQEKLWQGIGFENNAYLQANSHGEAVGSGGLNATTRDAAIMMDVMINGGKSRKGEQIISKVFTDNVMNGNDEVKSAWKHNEFSLLLSDAWYKDQIWILNVEGHRFMTFVGIHGQVIVGEPSTGIVIAMNGAQNEMQAARTVGITYLEAIPALLNALKQK